MRLLWSPLWKAFPWPGAIIRGFSSADRIGTEVRCLWGCAYAQIR